MTIRITLLLSALLPAPIFAQPATPPAAEAPKDDLVRVALETEKGRIVLALDRARAPATVANFLRYVEAKRFDGITFYRAMTYPGGGGLIQAGITKDARLQFPPVKHESTAETGLKHEEGVISMANAGPGTARSDFFILASATPSLDATTTNPGFAVFGRVVEGMDVVKAILAAPTDPNKGAGSMKGQMIAEPVMIRSARRESE
ncbi:peptidylprolyl isomerase [Sphingomonas arenae]|uniref:peptidylprolyl isomerase n=1 Tax=Sphingomonas arenae TaxID=2812555 RepID=UPI0019680250|nr:peptidylprolyl isomerase [Sphingomonas arenae]